jgi:prepilin-type processing-associated H-X9-DG protein
MAILMPTLAKAHEAANRTACLSNLRQVHQMFMYYALDNRDQVPLGYRAGRKQINSMIFSATTNRIVLFGLLYQVKLMRTPAMYFCPAEINEQMMLDTQANPWPPGIDSTKHTYAGYGARPEFEIPDDPADWWKNPLPRMTKLKSKAIFADLTSQPVRLDTRHRAGINVLYGDGSARWVRRSTFDDFLKPCTTIAPQFNQNMGAIWNVLDRQ